MLSSAPFGAPLFVVLLASLTLACATSANPALGTGGAGAGGSGSGGAGGAGAGGAGAGGAGGEGGIALGGGGGAGGSTPSILYVHTNTNLFEGDPAEPDLALTQLGAFDCLGGDGQDMSMTDIAVNELGEVWSISKNRVYRLELQPGVVHCAEVMDLAKPADVVFFGLTFAPRGVLDPNAEVLVAGNTAGELWSIAANGTTQKRGTLGVVPSNDGQGHTYDHAGKAWELSGDIVFLANGGSPVGFATVRDCPSPPSEQGCATIDTLLELDVAAMATATTQSVAKAVRGKLVEGPACPLAGPGSFEKVFGVAAYGDKVFGFARSPDGQGLAVEINNTNGTACLRKSFDGVLWAGAGITTQAPVVVPN